MKITNIVYHSSALSAVIYFDEIDRAKLLGIEADTNLLSHAKEKNHRISRFRGLSVYSGDICIYAVDVLDKIMEVQKEHAEDAEYYTHLIFGESLFKMASEFKERKQSDSNCNA